MSSAAVENDGDTADTMADQRDRSPVSDDAPSSDGDTIKGDRDENRIADILEEERQTSTTPAPIGNGLVANRYRDLLQAQEEGASDDGSVDGLPRRAGSPVGSLSSFPGDSPSVQGSMISSPTGSGILPSLASRPGLNSPTPSFRPFDRRFQSRISSSSSMHSPRPQSPAFPNSHSRNVSLSSNAFLDPNDTDTPTPPWEVVRWTKLKKLNGQAFTEAGKRNFGSPTCVAVSTAIVLGTTKGIILMFDYNQNLKMIIGPGTKAVESGPITAIAISADHTTIAGGHENGNIFTWDTSRASRPFLSIPHLAPSQLLNRTVDGHMPNVAITHLGFLGTRHTALVSADDRGMAFSHLATRGTGALGRTVKTTRILGRYPNTAPPSSGKPIKPSTVLGFASLPLGNLERGADSFGLTAMLTPYLLVIVSTTPIAQTQHKSARPKEVAHHTAVTGCLAWFPAVKLKVPDPVTGSQISKVKLVYCWSNVLTVLEVDEVPGEDKDKPPTLKFKARSRWKCEEPIVAVQWLSRSVITVLTITQRLIVLEDRSMRMTEGFDLIHKHIYHVDLFSKQLHALVEQLDEDDTSMHGVVADAFYMSFKAYKGRIFLLGFNDISIGALSNWADRLIALMEHGDYVAAIQLATSYYTGDADKLTVGLPEDASLRHTMVKDKVTEIMSASLKYAFSQRQKNPESADDDHLRELAETCFTASQSVGELDFLFDEMYEWYENAEVEGIFLETLEPYILDQIVRTVPPTVVKAMVSHFVAKGWESRLEEMICHMETATLDLDQLTMLCKHHRLYDALIYVWNQALNDYITPLIDLLALLVPMMQNGDSGDSLEDSSVDALKMFPYISYVLTGRVYPTGDRIADELASNAKAELYWFLFSGKSIAWPRGSTRRFRTQPSSAEEPSFPYLRMILKFDAPSFLSALNEAFEDPFLNDSPEKQSNGTTNRDSMLEEQIFGLTVDRQYILSILMEIMNPSDFAPEDTTYLDMFIARNLPKFPQYLLFPGSTLIKVLTGLCSYPGDDLAEDAQLSAEYLLSVYHPPDNSDLIPLFKKAGFFRILKRIYRAEKQYGQLIHTYFEDQVERDGVFDCIRNCLRPQSGLTKRQTAEVHEAIKAHARDLVEEDAMRAANTLAVAAPELHRYVLDTLDDEPELQYRYLNTLLEPEGNTEPELKTRISSPYASGPGQAANRELIEQYVRLMCRFDAAHVSDYVGLVQGSAHLRLDELLPTMEETGVIDAAVVLMAREGQVQEAMERLVKHLRTLEGALRGLLIGSAEEANTGSQVDLQDAAEELIRGLQKFVHVGIWLCQGQMLAPHKGKRKQNHPATTAVVAAAVQAGDEPLNPDEMLWLNLIETSVQITRRLSSILVPDGEAADKVELDTERLLHLLRTLVQHTFTALLTATTSATTTSAGTPSPMPSPNVAQSPFSFTSPFSPTSVKGPLSPLSTSGTPRQSLSHSLYPPSTSSPPSFIRILKAFLSRAASTSPSLADLRQVLSSIFAAYTYETRILALSNSLLGSSLFTSVKKAAELRARGWRPRASTCEACKRRVWGPGVPAALVIEAWEAKEKERRERAGERRRERLRKSGVDVDDDEDGAGIYGVFAGGLSGGHGKGKGSGESVRSRGKKRAETSASEELEMLKASKRPSVVTEPERSGTPISLGMGRTSTPIPGGAGTPGAPAPGTGTPTLQLQIGNMSSRTNSPAPAAGFNGAKGAGARVENMPPGPVLGPLVVLACRHVYHQSCLEVIMEQERVREQAEGELRGFVLGRDRGEREYRCPIDG